MLILNRYQKKWLKFIPTGTFFTKTKNHLGCFLQNKKLNNKFELFNWIKLWFFLKYSLLTLKNSIIDNFSILIVSDYKNISKTVTTIAKQLNFFFATGPWEGGRLTKTFWYKYTPSFVIVFGITYPKNFYNELKILGIPCFNLTEHFILKKKNSNSYLIPFSNKQATSFKNFVAFFSYSIYKMMYTFLFNNFLIKRTFNPFYNQILRSIHFKIEIVKKKINKIIKVFVLKKKKTLFFLLFLNLNKKNLLKTLKIAYYKKWIIKDKKKFLIQNFIKKDKLYNFKNIKENIFICENKQFSIQQQKWLFNFLSFYINAN